MHAMKTISIAFFYILALTAISHALSEEQNAQEDFAHFNQKTPNKPMPIHGEAFLISLSGYSYLIGNSVWGNSWQWASFMTEEHVSMHGTAKTRISMHQFEIVLGENQTFQIKCQSGNSSVLALKPLTKDSWQWAFFASEQYLARHQNLVSRFRIIVNIDGSFSIESVGKIKGILALESSGKSFAFFATKKYLDSSEKTFCTSFWLNDKSVRKIYGLPDV